MCQAIKDNKSWKSGNTEVQYVGDNLSIVYLHGNKIAVVDDTTMSIFDGGWKSVTTKSRLNAILSEHGDCGDKVFAKNFDWFISMNTAEGITTVPFFSSMRLANY